MEPIAIIGTGLIGRAWAMVFARAGHPVRLFDTAPGATGHALALIGEALREQADYGLLPEPAEPIHARITAAASLEQAVEGVVYVQENTAERLEVKREVFAQLDRLAPPEAILASSTSMIPASEFSVGLPGRHRMLVAHPVNPPHVIPVVEISPAPWTSPEVVARTRALQESVGQVAVTVKKEIQGFILNRLQAALLCEAWELVKGGYVSVEDLDKTIRDGLGLRWALMGPFETIDLNAPGGVADYAARYGPVMTEIMREARYEPWDAALIEQVEAERRAQMPASEHAEREAWRDRRLMALALHKREMAKKDTHR